MKYPYIRTKVKGRPIDRHRLIMERLIGRKLKRFELVHHINENKRDNRIENLEIVTPAIHAVRHGMWKHPKVKTCQVCGCRYEPSPTKRKSSKTCSKKCRYTLISEIFRDAGKPRSMYRDGAYPSEIKSRRNSSKPSVK